MNLEEELRRLHAENERLCQINQSHEMKLSVRGYEIQIADLEAQRDALLKVVQIVDAHYSGSLDYRPSYVQLARAAIKAAQEEK